MLTGNVLSYLEFLDDTLVDFLQGQSHLQSQVAASMLLWPTCATAEATETVTAEDVAEHREDVVHVHRCPAKASETAAHRSVKTELVVLLTLLWVVQHVVGLGSLLELLLGFLVAGVTVGVIFDGYLAIRLLDLVF